jgi:hypothetical protein
MHRRTLLGAVSTATLLSLTGCLGDDGGGDGTPTDTSTDTDTETPTPTPPPLLTDSEFTVLTNQGGTQTDNARVSVDASTVTVDGSIWGHNGCQTATLGSANHNRETNELTVDVATTREEGAGDACTEGIVEIGYRATLTFENGLPSRVVVTHSRGDTTEEVTATSL